MTKRALSVCSGALFAPLLVTALLIQAVLAQDRPGQAWVPSSPPGAEAQRALEEMSRLQDEVQRLHFQVRNETNTAQRVKLQRRLIARRALFLQARQRAVFLTNPFVRHSREVVQALLRQSFPELPSERLSFHPIDSDTTFFNSFFSFSEPFLKRHRTYHIGINPDLFEGQSLPPVEGIRGILCHELAHSLDYQRRTFFGLWGVLAIFLKSDSNRRFERWADLQAISRGCGAGLVAYRQWVYQQVSPQERERRQHVYLPPQHIEAVEEVRSNCPSAMSELLQAPPLSLEAIQAAGCSP
ncbi:MAG TPA: hypothetical protein VLV83_18785 [Acidobacteriota bacterium]|nr:hypothetical protein [Acidobacteriota bacterium]